MNGAQVILTVISAVSAICAIMFGFLAFRRNDKYAIASFISLLLPYIQIRHQIWQRENRKPLIVNDLRRGALQGIRAPDLLVRR